MLVLNTRLGCDSANGLNIGPSHSRRHCPWYVHLSACNSANQMQEHLTDLRPFALMTTSDDTNDSWASSGYLDMSTWLVVENSSIGHRNGAISRPEIDPNK